MQSHGLLLHEPDVIPKYQKAAHLLAKSLGESTLKPLVSSDVSYSSSVMACAFESLSPCSSNLPLSEEMTGWSGFTSRVLRPRIYSIARLSPMACRCEEEHGDIAHHAHCDIDGSSIRSKGHGAGLAHSCRRNWGMRMCVCACVRAHLQLIATVMLHSKSNDSMYAVIIAQGVCLSLVCIHCIEVGIALGCSRSHLGLHDALHVGRVAKFGGD